MPGWAPGVLAAFVLAAECGGGAVFVSWNTAANKSTHEEQVGGASAGVVACRPDRSVGGAYVLMSSTDGSGTRWAAHACRPSPASEVDCLRGNQLEMPEGWSVSCDHRYGDDGLCVCGPR